MKRQTLLILALFIAVVIVTDVLYFANQTVTLNFYSHPDMNGALRESIAAFESKNPKIHINLVELPDNTNEKYEIISSKLALKDGSVDILDSDVTWPSIFVESGWVEPLDRYFTEKELSEHFSSSIEAAKVGKKLYGIPYRFDSGLIYYRKDLLDQYGFKTPSSFSELMAISRAITLKEDGLFGYAGSWKNFEGLTCNYLEFLWACDGELIINQNESPIVRMDAQQGYDALKLMTDLIYKYQITPEEVTTYSSGDVRKLFSEGRLLFMRDWPAGWAVINAPDSKVKDKVAVMPFVHLKNNATSPGTYGGWQYMISKYSRHKSASVKFLKFITSDNEQRKGFEAYSYLPSKKNLYFDDALIHQMPFAQEMVDYFNQSKLRPRQANYDQISLIIQTEVHKTLLGDQSPEEAIINMNDLLSKLE